MFSLKERIGWLPAEIWPVTIANMLVAISTTMAFSISPFYITAVLGISMFSMGAMEGFTEGLSQISKLFSGISSDYSRKKKPTLIFGVLMTALSKPFFILAAGVGGVMTSKILERMSNGVIATPRDAYVADISTRDTRGACYGIMMTGKTVGCIIGPFLVSFLTLFTENYRVLLWLGLIPCLVAVILLWKGMNEEVPGTQINLPLKTQESRLSLKDITKLPLNYWSLLITSSLFMFARFSDGFLALRLKELGAPTWLCMATIGIFNAISALCCYPIGRLSDKIDRSKLLYFSYITLLFSNVCFIFATDLWLGLVGVLLWGAQRGSSQILFTAIVADESPKRIMGTAIGLFYIVIGVMSLLAGAVCGWFADGALAWSFVFGASISTLATISLALRNRFFNRPTIVSETPVVGQGETLEKMIA